MINSDPAPSSVGPDPAEEQDRKAEIAPRVRPPDGLLLAGWVLTGVAGVVLTTLLVGVFAVGAIWWLLPFVNLVVYSGQWAILRAYLPGLRWSSWVGPSILAVVGFSVLLGILSTVMGEDPFGGNPYLQAALGGALSGASIGFAQSLILGRYVRHSEWWIPAYALGQAAQNVAAQALANVVDSPQGLLPTLFVAGPIGAVLGLVTGVALGALLRNPVPAPALTALLARQAAWPRGARLRAYVGTGLLLMGSLVCFVLAFAFLNPGPAPLPAAPLTPPSMLRPDDIPPGWQVFTSDDGRFQIVFPTTPAESTQDVGSTDAPIRQHVFSADTGGSRYVVVYSDNAIDLSAARAQTYLDDIRNGAIDTSHGQLQDEQPIMIQGYPGRDVHLRMGDGRFLRMWSVIAGRRIYSVLIFTPASAPESDEALKFLHSFQLLGP